MSLYYLRLRRTIFCFEIIVSTSLPGKKCKRKKHINSVVDLPLCVFSPQKVKASYKEHVNIIAELYHIKHTALFDCLSAWRSFAKRMTCLGAYVG